MATTENKSLQQLIKKFSEASNQTKELDKVISNFSSVVETFYMAVDDLDKRVDLKELSALSIEATERLKEIKSYDEFQLLDQVETIVKKQVTSQMKATQKLFSDFKKENHQEVNEQLQKITAVLLEEGKQENHKNQEEMLNLLQRIEAQTRYPAGQPYGATQQNNEEITKLRRMISTLNSKISKLEEDYEVRITMLENEVELLRKNPAQSHSAPSNPFKVVAPEPIIDLSDDDLPF